MTGKRKNTREGIGNCGSVSEEDKEDRNGSQENILCCKERGKFMSERENLPRIERQLRLYEMVCQYVSVKFSDVCEKFPYNMRLLQWDLADLKDAGLVSVKYSKRGKGYVKTGVPEFNEKAASSGDIDVGIG